MTNRARAGHRGMHGLTHSFTGVARHAVVIFVEYARMLHSRGPSHSNQQKDNHPRTWSNLHGDSICKNVAPFY